MCLLISVDTELISNMSINLSGYRVDFKCVYQSQWIQSCFQMCLLISVDTELISNMSINLSGYSVDFKCVY